MIQEFNSTLDGSEADGALGYFNNALKLRDVRVAIELKGANIPLDKKQHRSSHLTPVREYLFKNTLLKVVEVYNVFPNAVVEPVISVYQKKEVQDEKIEVILVPRNTALSSTFISDGISQIKEQSLLLNSDDFVFNYKIDESKNRILGTILDNSKKLSEYFYVYNGAKPYEVGKGTPPQTKEIQKNKIYNGYNKIDDS